MVFFASKSIACSKFVWRRRNSRRLYLNRGYEVLKNQGCPHESFELRNLCGPGSLTMWQGLFLAEVDITCAASSWATLGLVRLVPKGN